MAVSALLLMHLLLLLFPIATIIAVAAVVVAAVDGSYEGRQFASTCGWYTAFPRSFKLYLAFMINSSAFR
jgi:hypothetical protein